MRRPRLTSAIGEGSRLAAKLTSKGCASLLQGRVVGEASPPYFRRKRGVPPCCQAYQRYASLLQPWVRRGRLTYYGVPPCCQAYHRPRFTPSARVVGEASPPYFRRRRGVPPCCQAYQQRLRFTPSAWVRRGRLTYSARRLAAKLTKGYASLLQPWVVGEASPPYFSRRRGVPPCCQAYHRPRFTPSALGKARTPYLLRRPALLPSLPA